MCFQNHFEDISEQDATDIQVRLQELEEWFQLEEPVFQAPLETIGNDEF